jgi:hypothetical protein
MEKHNASQIHELCSPISRTLDVPKIPDYQASFQLSCRSEYDLTITLSRGEMTLPGYVGPRGICCGPTRQGIVWGSREEGCGGVMDIKMAKVHRDGLRSWQLGSELTQT